MQTQKGLHSRERTAFSVQKEHKAGGVGRKGRGDWKMG